jgi:hypothetical protein
VYFGQPVSLTTDGYVIDPTTTVISATNFAGVAIINVQTYLTYPTTQNSTQRGYYPANAPCDIIQQGIVSVYIQRGTSINQSGTVYVRTATNGSYPTAVVGGFETSADGSNTVALTNAVWNTNKIDANGIAELFILYPIAG